MSIVATKTRPAHTPTAPDLIRAMAVLIAARGYAPAEAGDDILTARPTLISAAAEVIHGCPCRERDLTEAEAELRVELLENLELGLGSTLDAWERTHTLHTRDQVAQELRMCALRVTRELAAS